jgi:hypothetical protein
MYSTWHALGLKSAHKLLGVARVLHDAGLITAVGCSATASCDTHLRRVVAFIVALRAETECDMCLRERGRFSPQMGAPYLLASVACEFLMLHCDSTGIACFDCSHNDNATEAIIWSNM